MTWQICKDDVSHASSEASGSDFRRSVPGLEIIGRVSPSSAVLFALSNNIAAGLRGVN